METDPRIEQILQITKDTNHTIHKMRRSMLWGRFFYIVVWLVVLFGPVIAYYFYYQSYVQPYIAKLQQLELQLQQANQTTQSYQSQISSFFGNFKQPSGFGSSTAPTTTKR